MSLHPYHRVPQRLDTPIAKDKRIPQFHEVMKPALLVQCIFGQCYLSRSLLVMFLVKNLFLIIFGFVLFVFILAVFNRGGIEMWVQFSLYIIPLLSFPCGAYIFNSGAYYRMLKRNLTSSAAVRFYVNNNETDCEGGNHQAAAHNITWLREIAWKSLMHPLALELLQWCAFLVFYFVFKDDYQNSFMRRFVGEVQLFKNSKLVWRTLYFFNWFLTVYIVGFVSYQFVFISRLMVRDTVNFMSLFGKTPYLKVYPVYDFHLERNFCFKILKSLANFVTMDLFNTFTDEHIYTKCADVSRQHDDEITPSFSFLPARVITTPFDTKQKMPSAVLDNNDNFDECDEENNIVDNKISPAEACEIFSTFIAEVESLTSVFMPFNIVLTFFAVANLITHVGLFIKNDDGHHLSAWTFFRTLLFLWVAIRMLVCVTVASSVLGKLPSHVNLIKTAGKLGYQDHHSPNWKDFTDLLANYNLGNRSFGFPMTLRQIASFVTVINMAFLIVFSVVKSNQNSS